MTSFRQRFGVMAGELGRNEKVVLHSVRFGEPAPVADLETARRLAGGALPPGTEGFYAEMNGFFLEWEHTVESLRTGTEADRGRINLLPVLDVFTPGKVVPGNVRPVDLFVTEACAAFVEKPGRGVGGTIHFHIFGEATLDTGYSFPRYLDRLLASRGYWYWLQTLCADTQENPEVLTFRKNMPLIFPDYRDELFQPLEAGA